MIDFKLSVNNGLIAFVFENRVVDINEPIMELEHFLGVFSFRSRKIPS